MANLTDLSLIEAAAGLRSGEISSRELTQACLERIYAQEEAIHAFLAITPDRALKMADRADRKLEAWREGQDEPLPLVHGIPIAVKDVLSQVDVPTTCGSKRPGT